jgi:hypothetical protein
MSFQSMSAELRGYIPKLPIAHAKILVNRAYRTIRERNLWSFQLWEGQWISPPQFSGIGTCTTVQGSNQVQLDATAIAELAAILPTQGYSLLTQRQFRISVGGTLSGLYNIWAYSTGTGILSLDRQFGEGSVTNSAFNIYQAYYVPQVNSGASPTYINDFKGWISVRNIQYYIDLRTNRYSRTQLDEIDPQRTNYIWPTDVVPYMRDANPASATYRYFMYELWGNPLSNYVFQLMGIRLGLDLVAPTDQLPAAIGEDVVLCLARSYAYGWAEANREHGAGNRLYYTGPDFKFLSGADMKQYDTLLKLYRQQDRDVVDSWFFIRGGPANFKSWAYYNTLSSTGYSGGGGY